MNHSKDEAEKSLNERLDHLERRLTGLDTRNEHGLDLQGSMLMSVSRRLRVIEKTLSVELNHVETTDPTTEDAEINYAYLQAEYRGSGKVGFDTIGSGLIPHPREASPEGICEIQIADEAACLHTIQVPESLILNFTVGQPATFRLVVVCLGHGIPEKHCMTESYQPLIIRKNGEAYEVSNSHGFNWETTTDSDLIGQYESEDNPFV